MTEVINFILFCWVIFVVGLAVMICLLAYASRNRDGIEQQDDVQMEAMTKWCKLHNRV